MRQIITTGTVLARTDFGEADRILTLLTPDHGKLRMIAKGVRRQKSKLAGGIELFSISDVSYAAGRGDLGRLVSARLRDHYGNIVSDINRTMLGYQVLKRINQITEDAAEPEYFELLQATMRGLDDLALDITAIELWFTMQVLRINGHAPNLITEASGERLRADGRYMFDADSMTFTSHDSGQYQPNHIKLLRMCHGVEEPSLLKQIRDMADHSQAALTLMKDVLRYQSAN